MKEIENGEIFKAGKEYVRAEELPYSDIFTFKAIDIVEIVSYDLPVGTIFSYFGSLFEVKEEKMGAPCKECSFKCSCEEGGEISNVVFCEIKKRKDNKNVYFKKV
jgi:hypothetical protein